MNIKPLHLILLCGLFLSLWFFNIGRNKLMEPDEGRYAEIPREMIVNNDFVTPRLNGLFYFEKPPLQYWMTAASFKLFGIKTWTARLATVATGAASVLAVFGFFYLVDGAVILALLSAVLLMSAPLHIILGHLNTLDTSLSFFLTLLMLAICLLIRPNLTKKQKNYANLLLWTSAALGLLTKGLLVLAVPGLAVFIYCGIRKSFTFFKNLNYWWGPALFLAIACPWFILVCKRNPDFFHFFFIYEHFERFLSKGHEREGPFWYFVPILLVGFFPTIFLFFRKKWYAQQDQQTKDTNLFLIVWSATFFIFFSISKSKLPPYILPIFPSIAILLAQIIMQMKDRAVTFLRIGYSVFIALGLGAAFYYCDYSTKYKSIAVFQKFSVQLTYACVFFVILLLIEKFLIRNKDYVFRVGYLCFACLIFLQSVFWAHATFSPTNSGYNLAQKVKPYLVNDIPLYSVTEYLQSAPFYLEHTMILVSTRGELGFGIDHTPNRKYIENLNDFIAEWNLLSTGIGISSRNTFETILKDKIKHVVIFEDERRVAFTRETSKE
jgi:4-amino-4-deoxy-L-arabinose transferase-like glycosyltransferase